jgi:hypothetical protein
MMDKAVTGRNLALALCEMLCIKPDCVRKLTVIAGIDGVAEVVVEGIVRTPEGRPVISGDRVQEFSKRYEVVEKNG